jgi:hypothetical protein
MRTLVCAIIAVLLMTAAGVPAQETVIDARNRGPIDQEHTKWIDSVMRSVATIKPGMKRKDLFTVFTEEGGLSTRTQKIRVQTLPLHQGRRGVFSSGRYGCESSCSNREP